MKAIIQLHNIYARYGYTIRTGLQPFHFPGNAYKNIPFTGLFRGTENLDVGGGISLIEMYFFASLSESYHPERIFIIGNAFGLSTVLLALLNPGARIVAIDAGIEGVDNDLGNELTRQIAKDEGLNIEVVNGYSPQDVPQAMGQLGGTPDMVFIDGLHTNNQQSDDFNACWPHGGAQCLYILHDVLIHKMMSSFEEISAKHPEMSTDILWRTASGICVLYSEAHHQDALPALKLFTEPPEIIKATLKEVRYGRLMKIPGVRFCLSLLPESLIRLLRNFVYKQKAKA